MKKWVCFLGTAFCFLFCTLSARADVIWEPEDSFYEKHSSECTHVGRQYIANSPDGVVILYESPESAKEVATWENGKQVYISFTYEDARGIVWGINDSEEIGWMPMEYMKVVYDSISFAEEFGDQIVSQTGSLDEQYENDIIYYWKYPGAESFGSIDLQGWDYLPEYHSVYTDETGHSWGYIGYYYGTRSVWICLDAPTADYAALYPDGGPAIGKDDTELYPKRTPAVGKENAAAAQNRDVERIVPKTNDRMVVIVVVLVAAVALVTAALLVFLRKRK